MNVWFYMDEYPNEVLTTLIILLVLLVVFQFTVVDKSLLINRENPIKKSWKKFIKWLKA